MFSSCQFLLLHLEVKHIRNLLTVFQIMYHLNEILTRRYSEAMDPSCLVNSYRIC